MSRTYFVTGTDTGVGKTLVTAALLLTARAAGLRAAAIKPVAAGGELRAGRPANADAVLLQQLSAITLTEEEVNPVALADAIAPHVAAERTGVHISIEALAAHAGAVRERHRLEVLLLEGAGGWLVPVSASETMADLPRSLRCPVILVVGMRLGCLNHALLTAQAIRAAGLELAGWVANSMAAPMPALDENIRALEERLPALRLGSVPWLGSGVTPAQASTWIDATALWG